MSLLVLLQNPEEPAGTPSIANNISLYMLGSAPINAGTTLFITGSEAVTGQMTLYTNGILAANKGLNLVCANHIPPADTSSIPLYIRSTVTPEQFGGVPLYLEGSHHVASLNLTLICDLAAEAVAPFNLYIKGLHYDIANNLPLFLLNDDPTASMTLFIKGEGVTPNSMPFNNSLNLFLERNTGDAITLYINSVEPPVASMDLYCHGAYVEGGGVDLVIPNVYDLPVGVCKLYIHGY